jgi:imidazoleglycerol phosphate synthase cyclase subunit
MTYPRLIPVLLLKHGLLVRSQQFQLHQVIGNPMSTIERLSNWSVDELVLLDIGQEDTHDLRRDDLQQSYKGHTALDVLQAISEVCLVPLAFGGKIRTLGDIEQRLAAGADKCVLNTQALDTPHFIGEAAARFGSQCIVVSIDARIESGGDYKVYSQGGKKPTMWHPAEWAKRVEDLGAGEIFLNSVDRDGMATGYDISLLRAVTTATELPVIACGGVACYEDFPAAIQSGGACAAAAANIFHFFELSYPIARSVSRRLGVQLRNPNLESRWSPRLPHYSDAFKQAKLARKHQLLDSRHYDGSKQQQTSWCKKCLYPALSAVPLEFSSDGICTGCLISETKHRISHEEWARRRQLLSNIVDRARCHDGSTYDCVVPVSGGKDSYFQTHYIINELGLKPLLVTYNGNNWTKEGWYNVHRMKEVFGVDHVFYSPSTETLKKLNRLGLIIMGDMNWHSHVGIMTLPMRLAVQHRIPLVFYGEHGYMDLGGQFSMNDFPEVSYRDRLEHFARGFEWNFFVGMEDLSAQDLIPYQYPSDKEMFDLSLRGLFLGNFVMWEANQHGQFVREKYGFRTPPKPFERTYRTMSNLDDMHENGAHDYLKFIKFGYGRCSDHVAKDIRAGLMNQDEGRKLILQYDHVKPSDLHRWYEYAGISEREFDVIADTFRDPRVWRIRNGKWFKNDVDGVEREYGVVHHRNL